MNTLHDFEFYFNALNALIDFLGSHLILKITPLCYNEDEINTQAKREIPRKKGVRGRKAAALAPHAHPFFGTFSLWLSSRKTNLFKIVKKEAL